MRKNEYVNEFGAFLDDNGYAPSIMQLNTDCECYLCGKNKNLNRHEVFQGVCNRPKSKRYGLWISICYTCHSFIHSHPQSFEARALDIEAECSAIDKYSWTIKEFILEFGKNYLEGEEMLNIITLMGRMTRDPEIRYTSTQTPVTSFTLAVDREYQKENAQKETDFIDCVAWRSTAEFISKYFQKGSMAVVEGRLQMRDWTDKEGNKRRNAEVIVEKIYFGGAKKDGNSQSTNQPPTNEFQEMKEEDYEDELPF